MLIYNDNRFPEISFAYFLLDPKAYRSFNWCRVKMHNFELRSVVPKVSIKGRDKWLHFTDAVVCDYLSLTLIPSSLRSFPLQWSPVSRRIIVYKNQIDGTESFIDIDFTSIWRYPGISAIWILVICDWAGLPHPHKGPVIRKAFPCHDIIIGRNFTWRGPWRCWAM